jgi:hypothetical protein
MAKQALGSQIKQAPAPPPQARLAAIGLFQRLIQQIGIGIETRQPVARGAGIMAARPPPRGLQREEIGELRDQPMAGHDAAGEKVPIQSALSTHRSDRAGCDG